MGRRGRKDALIIISCQSVGKEQHTQTVDNAWLARARCSARGRDVQCREGRKTEKGGNATVVHPHIHNTHTHTHTTHKNIDRPTENRAG